MSHCFPLNGNENDPFITGVDAVITSYEKTLKTCTMLGPTRFSGVLKECKKWVEECKDPKMFHVVLILTDGDIHDLKETIEEIIDASKRNLPMSIIIVGVGNEDFSSMVRLDGDDYAL